MSVEQGASPFSAPRRREKGFGLFFAVLCLLVLPGAQAFAADFTVTKTLDTNDAVCNADCSLREAIVAANAAPGADRIILGSGLTYTLTRGPADASGALTAGSGDLDVIGALTIDGNGSTVNAQGLDRVFDIQGSFLVTINNLTITGGAASGFLSLGGGLNIRGASVVLNSCVVTGNSTVLDGGVRDDGGGIAVAGSYTAGGGATLAALTLNSSTVSSNSGLNGGGILCVLCALTLNTSTISGNTASGGNGGGIDVVGNASMVSALSTTLASNTATGAGAQGGGLSVPFGTSLSSLSRSRIVSNTATAGSALFANVATVTATNNWWGCNFGPGTGGAGCAGTPNGVSGAGGSTPYLVLKTGASPAAIVPHGSSAATADLRFNSTNADTSGGGTVPNGIVGAFSGTLGTFATPTATTTTGIATDVYTNSGTTGTAVLTVVVDGQTVSSNVIVAAAAPTVVTGIANPIGRFSATLNGTANPNSSPTSGQFAYGLTAAYGATTPVQTLGGGFATVPIDGGAITSLACGTVYHFRATATNAINTTNGSDATFTTAVCSTPPVVSDIADRAIGMNGSTGAIAFTVGDDETAPGALSVSGGSSNTTLVPNANVVFGGSGANRTVTVTPAADQTGITTITVSVTDGDGQITSDTFLLTVMTVVLTIGDVTVVEGQTGSVNAVFDVTVTPLPAATVTVQYATAQRTAIGGLDFTPTSGTLTFNPGVGLQTISVPVLGDTAVEIDETFTVNLTGPVNATVGDGEGVGTITDDDATVDRRAALATWTSPVGVTALPGTLTKTVIIGWNAGAASAQALLDGDGSMEFTASEAATIRAAGLSRGNTNTDFSDIDFGIELYQGRVYVIESGVSRGTFGLYQANDRFAVAVENGVVVYRKNGVALFTSAVTPAYPLLADTALYTPATTVVDVVLSGRLARPVTWTNLVGVSASGGSLTKTAAIGWNAGAASTRALVAGDGSVEFVATETNTSRILGLSADNASTDFSDVDFGVLLSSNGTWYVFEAGVSRGVFGSYAAGDRFQIAVEAGQVIYRRNNVTTYTSLVAPAYPLLVDTALFSPGATLADVALAGTFAADVTFAGAAGVGAAGNTLTKTAALGWNAGAFSTRALVKGDGFVEFTSSEATSHKVAGLSHGNTNTNFADIDFGVLLASNGTVYVFEAGTSRGVFGVYQAGDRFRVAVEAGVVKYRRNGVLFFTSAAVPAYPLLVDTALYSPAATVADVVLSGDLGEVVTWTAIAGVSAPAAMLTKTGAIGWNAGAISTRAIASGDGFVSFTTGEATTQKLIGLSTGNTNTNFSDIDFGILLASNGTYYVFEAGASRGVFGAYVAGDRFQVAVEGGVLKYLKNGAVFYTGGVAPAYPLLVDTALYTPGATLTDVVLGCVGAACQ